MRYAGTSRRPPCPVCEGSGIEPEQDAQRAPVRACIVCNGTGAAPVQRGAQAAQRAARSDAQARHARPR
jgi:DnaJ-class molecular chaperone